MNLGLDCDGVLTEFTLAFTNVMAELYPGHSGLPLETSTQPSWELVGVAGITEEMKARTWKEIQTRKDWWVTLCSLPSNRDLGLLAQIANHYPVYVVTNRQSGGGRSILAQTQEWLWRRDISASVIVTRHKGEVARALRLDWFLDDKFENCEEVAEAVPTCSVRLVQLPSNQGRVSPRIKPVEGLHGFLEEFLGGSNIV